LRGFVIKRLKTEGLVVHRAEVFDPGAYHFIVQRDGKVIDNLPVDEKGAHALEYNSKTIGIAIYGDFAALEPGKYHKPTPEQIAACITLMQKLNKMYGGKLWAAGHSQLGLKGTSVPLKLTPGHTCPGENFPLASVILKSGCKIFVTI
jgi:N-acetyl-anhydromuramyl-L-alanine amidase AmpD